MCLDTVFQEQLDLVEDPNKKKVYQPFESKNKKTEKDKNESKTKDDFALIGVSPEINFESLFEIISLTAVMVPSVGVKLDKQYRFLLKKLK